MTQRKRITTTAAWIQVGELVPWMLGYAQWLAQHPEAELTSRKGEKAKRSHRPTSLERALKATTLAHRRMDRRLIAILERRLDFREYFDKLRADAHFHAKELARKQIAANLEAREEALKRASGRIEMPDGTVRYAEMDISEVRQLTSPFVDLAFPKKTLDASQAPRIVIQIGSDDAMKQIRAVLEEGDDIQDGEFEVEELGPQRLLEDGDG